MTNNKIGKLLLLIGFALSLNGCGSTSDSANQSDNDNPPPKTTAISMIPAKQKAVWADKWWEPRHHQKIADAKNTQVDLLMIGDSITHNWESDGKQVWQQYYGHRKAFNLGFGGDRTEQVLWRINNGALDNMDPKLTVLMIGTNNTDHRMDSPYDTVFGTSEIINGIRKKLPNTKILLLAIFPRGKNALDKKRRQNEIINQYLGKLADGESIHFLNINQHFIDDQGKFLDYTKPDKLHLNEAGYKVWAEAMEPTVVELLK